MVVRLADVNEKMLVHWFKRNMSDFHKYNHPMQSYKINPYFNDKYQELPQIVCSDLDKNGREIDRLAFTEHLFCQNICFYTSYGQRGLLVHMAGCRWGIELPDRNLFSRFLGFMYLK